MKITSTPQFNAPRSLPGRAQIQQEQPKLPGDRVELKGPQQSDPTPPPSNQGKRLLAGVAGAVIGIAAGCAGPAGLAAAAGLGAVAVTVAKAGPMFQEGLNASLNGDPLNDVMMTCGTIAAGAMLTATVAGAAAGLTLPIGLLLPAAAPLVGGLIGAAVGNQLAPRDPA